MKIKAFTLLEMLLVLALTGLVLAISWGVYSNFYLFSREYEKRNELNQELALLDETLRRDCQRADGIQGDSTQVVLSGETPVSYQVIEKGILRRTNAMRDSFLMLPPTIRLDSSAWEYRLQLAWSGKRHSYRILRTASARKLP